MIGQCYLAHVKHVVMVIERFLLFRWHEAEEFTAYGSFSRLLLLGDPWGVDRPSIRLFWSPRSVEGPQTQLQILGSPSGIVGPQSQLEVLGSPGGIVGPQSQQQVLGSPGGIVRLQSLLEILGSPGGIVGPQSQPQVLGSPGGVVENTSRSDTGELTPIAGNSWQPAEWKY
jgi:hypothetical protein